MDLTAAKQGGQGIRTSTHTHVYVPVVDGGTNKTELWVQLGPNYL